jgi:tRNA dimethylallyltransferase
MNEPAPLVTVIGPTASGKTRLAVALAKAIGGEILSADSRQVYRGMDIGTGKDLEEYDGVPFHLIDICEAGERYNLYEYQQDFTKALQQVRANKNVPILCGGSGLYMEAVLKGYDFTSVPINEPLRQSLQELNKEQLQNMLAQTPSAFTAHADFSSHKRLIRAIEIAQYLQTHTQQPLHFSAIQNVINIGIDLPRDERRQRIATRLEKRLQNGLVEEVERLLAQGVSPETLVYYGLEYKFVMQHLAGEINREQLQKLLTIAIQQFAKRQMTFFRKMERDGFNIFWIDGTLSFENQVRAALEHIENYKS